MDGLVTRWVRIGMVVGLAVPQLVVGVWAMLAPHHWYENFPGVHPHLIAAEPPYNAHLATDAGIGFFCTAVALIAAAAFGRRSGVYVALLAYAAFAVPHVLYHALNPAPALSGAEDVTNVLFLLSGVALAALFALGSDLIGAPSAPAKSRRSYTPRVVRGALDRLIVRIAKIAARGFYRRVETAGFADIDRERPTLFVANHFNGFADPVLVVAALGRLPRFLAKATLWKVVVLRPLLAFAGVIPVHRQVDGGAGAANRRMFEAAEGELRGKGTVGIFPEGTTHDRPQLAPIRTGAARIVLGAKEMGVEGLTIVPVGLWFEDKVALRSRVLVRAGEPMDVDREIAAIIPPGSTASDDDREAVLALTAAITERLRAVSPDYDTFLDGAAFSRAADVALRDDMRRPQQSVPLVQREPLATQLARAPEHRRTQLINDLGRYTLALEVLGVTDEELVPRTTPGGLFRRVLWLAIGVLLLAPFAIAGALINFVPALLVLAAGLLARSPVTKGTVRLLVAIVVFPLTWLAVAWFDVGGAAIAGVLTALTFPLSPLIDVVFDGRAGFWPSLLVFVTAPIFGLCAILILEWAVGLFRMALGWYAVYARRAQVEEIMAMRTALVAEVWNLADQPALSR